jgi:hypothetical protein
MISGSLLTWAILRAGKADAWILGDLETLVRPYRTTSARSRCAGRAVVLAFEWPHFSQNGREEPHFWYCGKLVNYMWSARAWFAQFSLAPNVVFRQYPGSRRQNSSDASTHGMMQTRTAILRLQA